MSDKKKQAPPPPPPKLDKRKVRDIRRDRGKIVDDKKIVQK